MELLLKDIVQAIGGKLIGDEKIVIKGVNSLNDAGTEDISFFTNPRYKKNLAATKAAAVVLSEKNNTYKGAQIITPRAKLAYTKVAKLFAHPLPEFCGISGQATIRESSRIGNNTSIYPSVYVGEKAEIGENVSLFPGVFIGNRVKIGDRTVIHPNVTILQDCLIGSDVIIHSGTVIGSDGFGFVRDGSTSVKIPQIGIVQIDDHVEIGANNCIDRASLGVTWIKRGVKTDNLVQIAHNVLIGEDTILVSQAGVAGSVRIGRGVIIGGQAGISDHLEIGDGVMIGSQSGVAKNIPAEDVVSGTPTMPHRLWLKISRLITRLPHFNERIRNFEKRIESLEKQFKKG